MLVLEASSLVDESVVEHSLHTQHERFLPAPTSRAVTALVPIRKAITPATRPLSSIALLREGAREKNQENGPVSQRRKFFQEKPVLRLTGMVFTVPGTRCRYAFRMSLTVVTTTAEKASPSMVPATPKREVRTAPKGAATPPAAILAGSTMCCLCWPSKATPSKISYVLPTRPYPPACIATHCNTIYRVTGMLMYTRRYLLPKADFCRAALRTMDVLNSCIKIEVFDTRCLYQKRSFLIHRQIAETVPSW